MVPYFKIRAPYMGGGGGSSNCVMQLAKRKLGKLCLAVTCIWLVLFTELFGDFAEGNWGG